jgi:hypothetical protein
MYATQFAALRMMQQPPRNFRVTGRNGRPDSPSELNCRGNIALHG